jgi:hypothetical protein
MPVPERVDVAKEKTRRVVDHVLYLLELHENNAIVLYSSTLSKQIPTSFAANAFNVFQQGLHQFELVRLCALWDRAELERENILTIIEFIDHPEVIESFAHEAASYWQARGGGLLNPSSDPNLQELETDALQRANEMFGQEQAQKARDGLRAAITHSREIAASQKLASVMNLRDKHLAHSLSKTRRERAGPLPPAKYGDERDLLDATLPIIEALYCWVNGASLSLEDSREIDRKNAKYLWESCTFNITR